MPRLPGRSPSANWRGWVACRTAAASPRPRPPTRLPSPPRWPPPIPLQLADRTVDTLSGGERARAKLARVLAGEPDWILADEPLANLDPPHQRDVLALLRGAAAAGKGVIVVLHQLEAAASAADDVVLLMEGD